MRIPHYHFKVNNLQVKRSVKLVLFIILIFIDNHIEAQHIIPNPLFKDIILKVDTLSFSTSKNSIIFQGHTYFSFQFTQAEPTCELIFIPNPEIKINKITLLKSSDFVQVDSLVFINQEFYRTKIKFLNLNTNQFVSLLLSIATEGSETGKVQEIKLMPNFKTSVTINSLTDELYIGEERVFELLSNNVENIKISGEWITQEDFSYRINQTNGHLYLHLLPNSLGVKTFSIHLQTVIPYINEKKEIIYDYPNISQVFKIKASRLAFLTIDKKDITFDDETRNKGVEVQIENNRQLIIGKTYRIENQEQAGGTLIAELFTKNSLSSDKVLCVFRPYNLHRQIEGFLYLKECDVPKFITNLSITLRPTVNTVTVLHQGQDWSTALTVNPGETVDVKLEGESLDKAKFHWEDVTDITSDTLIRNEHTYNFTLKIPISINNKHISLYNQGTNTGIGLNVKEFQVPRNFDYISLNFGSGNRILSTLAPTVIQRTTIKDIIISFDNFKIDSENKLFGKQYIDVDVRLINKRGEQTEVKTIKNILLCPGDNSPRSAFYKDKTATNGSISLNTLLGNKTYNMDDFSKVQLEFRNQSDKYTDPANDKQVEIVLQRKASFDFDVSFPAGLLIQNLGQSQTYKSELAQYNTDLASYNTAYSAYVTALQNWNQSSGPFPVLGVTEPVKPQKPAFTDNLGGVSLALIIQVSFPDQEKVGAIKPYRLGVGFLAINAFNFSQGAERDLALVALGSFYPIRPGRVFSLPIHFGFGYKLQDATPFIMLSPGIGIQF